MNYEFDARVDRRGIGNMKWLITPEAVRDNKIEGFNAAEMDFKTAPCILRALHALIDRGIFGFTVQTDAYNERIQWWLRQTRQWTIDPEWIVPAYGTIFSVATAIRMTCEPDEGIIVQSPVYYRYAQAAKRLDRPVFECPLGRDESHFFMDFDAFEDAMANPKARLMILCNPHNPTGNVWPREDLEKIAALSQKYGVVVFSDEIFADDTSEGHQVIPYASIEAGKPLAITCTSLGKNFNYTGVNHADLIIPDDSLRQRFRRQRDADHFGSIGPFEYTSVVSAYTPEGLEWVQASREYMEENKRIVQNFFTERLAPNYVYPMEGAYVAFIEWRGLNLTGDELHQFLEKEAQFVLEPGDHYSADCRGFSRMSLGSTHAQTIQALERVEAAIKRHPEILKKHSENSN